MGSISRLACMLFAVAIPLGMSSLSLLGIRSTAGLKAAQSGGSNAPQRGSEVASFDVDTSNAEMTRLIGKGVKLDLNTLEVAALDGVFKFSNTNAQFEKGRSTWKSTIEESTLTYYHNNRNVIFLDILESLQDSTFKFVGDAMFHDVRLSDSALSHAIMTNLCKTDRIFSPLPLGVVDEALNQAAVEKCFEDMQSTSLSVSSLHEYMSKLLIAAASHHAASKASISQLHNTVANLSTAVSSSAEGKERDRVRGIMTEFEAVVDALRLEVTGKVKGMGSSIDLLRAEWVQVGSMVEAFNVSLADIVASRLLPVEQALNEDRALASEQRTALNTTVNDLAHHVHVVHEARMQQLNESIVGLEEGQSTIQDKMRYKLASINSSLLALADDLALTRDALNKTVDNTALELHAAIQECKIAQEAAAAETTLAMTALQQNVTDVQQQTSALHGSLSNLTIAVEDQRASVDALSLHLEARHADIQTNVTGSVGALHEQVMAEFGHMRREVNEAVVKLNESVSATNEKLNSSVVRLEHSLLEGLSAAKNASESYTDTQHAAVLVLIESLTNTSTVRHQHLEETVANASAQIRWELTNVTLAHWNATAASIAELTTNTSHVVARSNSILARAIGEVNSSMLVLTEALQHTVEAVREQAQTNLSLAVDALSAAAAEQVRNLQVTLTADLAAVQTQTKDDIIQKNAEVSHLVAELSNRVNTTNQEWSSSLEAHKADAAATTLLLNNTISEGLSVAQASAAQQFSNLSNSLADIHLNLSTSQLLSDSALRQDLAAAVASLNSSFGTDMRALNETLGDRISAFAVSTEEHVTSSTDKLRYMLAALNSSVLKQRGEDQTALEGSLTAVRASHEALEQRLTNSSQSLQAQLTDLGANSSGALQNISATLQVKLASVEKELSEKARNSSLETQERFIMVSERIDSVNAALLVNVSSLARSVEEGRRVLNASIDETKAHLLAADEEVLRTTERSLKEQVLVLQAETAAKVNASATAASASLNAAVSALQGELNTAIQGVTAQSASNHSALSATVQKMDVAFASSKEALSEQITKVQSGLNSSVEAHRAATTARFEEQGKEIIGVSDSLKNATRNLEDKMSAQSTKFAADVETVRTALVGANISLTKRFDASDAALAELSSSTTGRFAVLSSDLTKLAAASNATASAVAAKAQQLHDTLSAEVTKGLASLNSSLSSAVVSAEDRARVALSSEVRTISTRIDEVQVQLTRDQKQLHTNLSTAISGVSSALTNEQQSNKAAHATLHSDIAALKQNQEKVNNATDAKLASLSASVVDLSAGLAKQASTLSNSLSNFTAQQKENQDALLVTVNERVRQAEVQQLLGAVVVEAVRNDTQRLSHTVASASERVAAVEMDSQALRSDVRHLQDQSKTYSTYYANFTVSVLPVLHSQVGALQQETAQLSANYKQVLSDVKAFRDETTEKLAAFGSKQVTADNAVQAKLQGLAEGVATHEAAIKVMQSRYIDTAVQANSTAVQVRALDTSLAATNLRVDDLTAQLSAVTGTQRQVSSAERQIAELTDTVKALQQSSAMEVRLLRDVADKQQVQVASLEELVRRQGADLLALQEENRRLLRDSSTTGSVDELRKLLFDLQGQMLTHSSKVLDLLLQPRSAVLVHNPNPCDKTTAACAEPATVSEGGSQ